MYQIKNLFFIILFFLVPNTILPHAVTNGFEVWRRLGDNILTVCKTKYFEQEYGLSYYYTTFPYIDSFVFFKEEKPLTEEIKNNFKKIVFINSEKDITDNINNEDPTLFVCTYLSPTPLIYEYVKNHPSFENEIHRIFTPINHITALNKTSKEPVIGVHVRKGGGFDWPLASCQEFNVEIPLLKKKELYLYKRNLGMCCEDIWPLRCPPGPAFITETKHLYFKKSFYADYIWAIKFPPDQYYIEQIKTMATLLPGKSLKIQLFTDDPNPEGIVTRYTKALKDLPCKITFDYRKTENSHDKNVIEDLFALAQCDGLISASSSFAFTAMILGNHYVIIYPDHAITMQDKVLIDKVKVITVENPTDSQTRKVKSSIYGINLL